MSIRSLGYPGADGKRLSSRSQDAGATWSTPVPEPQLPDAGGCAGSVVSGSAGTVYYSHPNAHGRTNMSVWVSRDKAATWAAPAPVFAGGSAYSSMAMLQGRADAPAPGGTETVALSFEKGGYKSIAFTTLTF